MRRIVSVAVVAVVASVAAAVVGSRPGAAAKPPVQHVLLISVDGLHQSDLEWYVANHPSSELAKLVRGGLEFSNAHTSDPSDSDPGGTAMMTGGDPRVTGVYYDVEYNHATYEAGTTFAPAPPAVTRSTTRRTTRSTLYPTCSTTEAATRSRPSTKAALSTRAALTRTPRRS